MIPCGDLSGRNHSDLSGRKLYEHRLENVWFQDTGR